RPSKSKQAARDVDYVAVLDIFWFRWLAANTRPKINPLGKLFAIDYTRQMNIARASVVTHSACFHNRLVHRRRTVKRVCARFIGKSGNGRVSRAVLQRYQRFGVLKLAVVSADYFILKIDNPLAGCRAFADKR